MHEYYSTHVLLFVATPEGGLYVYIQIIASILYIESKRKGFLSTPTTQIYMYTQWLGGNGMGWNERTRSSAARLSVIVNKATACSCSKNHHGGMDE